MWGDADPYNVNSWTEMIVESAENKMEWNDELRACDDVITGFTYDLLTSQVGAANNPQNQVGLSLGLFNSSKQSITNT